MALSRGSISGQRVISPTVSYINVSDELSDPGHEFTLMMPAPKAFADTMRE